jgi:membrane-bound serine protease (ClpP class)
MFMFTQYIRRIVLYALIALSGLYALSGVLPSAQAQAGSGPLYAVTVEGTFTSVTRAYLQRVIQQAEAAQANALIVRLHNQGGVLRDARVFAKELADANVPIVVFVDQPGSDAGAVGSFFLSAAHISVLTPNTSFGSAYPLAEIDQTLSQQTRDLLMDSVVQQLTEWNARHQRNTEWLERAVREGIILTNQQAIALDPPAVTMVVANEQELLLRLEGHVVELANGQQVSLATIGRTPLEIVPTPWELVRLFISIPTVAFILLLLAALSLYFEMAAPGTTIFAGIGLVLLVVAAMGLFVLPIRWWSVLILLGALVLIGFEVYSPMHGIAAISGLSLVMVSALTLIDPVQAPNTLVSVWIIVLLLAGMLALVVLGAWLVMRTREQPVSTGQEGLIGRLAQVRTRLEPQGMVFVEGALWQAISEQGTVEVGDWVRVRAMHELQLIVTPLTSDEQDIRAGGS